MASSDGSDRAPLTQGQALYMRAKLAKEGKAICENCQRVGPIRDSLVVMYRGNVLTAACPSCLPKRSVLISKTETAIQVRLVDPDRMAAGAVQLATPQEQCAITSMDHIGPKITKMEG